MDIWSFVVGFFFGANFGMLIMGVLASNKVEEAYRENQ